LRLRRKNVVEVHWPETFRGGRVTHLPSRRAAASWLEIAGFREVEPVGVYSWYTGWQRAVFLARRGPAEAGTAAEQRAAMAWVGGPDREQAMRSASEAPSSPCARSASTGVPHAGQPPTPRTVTARCSSRRKASPRPPIGAWSSTTKRESNGFSAP